MKTFFLILTALILPPSVLWSAALNKYNVPLNAPGSTNVQQYAPPQRSDGLTQQQRDAIARLNRQDPATQQAWITRMRELRASALQARRYDEADYYDGIIRYWERREP
ncbi:hypothetical protein WCX49_04615 [Sulfurimonas sp. HSL-1656]|uniref:hypothetical protein n=1 Tax=Thiomicrolovo subterrani TaxID=3131934 RepID=UPI0031F89BB7